MFSLYYIFIAFSITSIWNSGFHCSSISLKQFRYFTLEGVDDDEDERYIVKQISESNSINKTEKQAIIKSRVGQGLYRANLMKKYDGKCVVTGIDKTKLLSKTDAKTIENKYKEINKVGIKLYTFTLACQAMIKPIIYCISLLLRNH